MNRIGNSSRLLLALALAFAFVSCGGKQKEIALAWTNDLNEKRERGIPVKCPFCLNGWGYILEDESDDAPIYCIWKEQPEGGWNAWVDSDGFWWHRKSTDDSTTTRPVTIDEESSWHGFLLDGDYGMQSGDTLETAMARLSSRPRSALDFCYSQFTYNQSLDEWERARAETKRFWADRRRKVEEDAKKSPEQRELEKITRELEELRKDVKKKK